MPFSVREGINIFLDGFVPTENMRFRTESLTFKVSESATEEEIKRMNHYVYPSMEHSPSSPGRPHYSDYPLGRPFFKQSTQINDV